MHAQCAQAPLDVLLLGFAVHHRPLGRQGHSHQWVVKGDHEGHKQAAHLVVILLHQIAQVTLQLSLPVQ